MTNLAHWHDDIDEALGGDFDGSLSGLMVMSLSFDFTRNGLGGTSQLNQTKENNGSGSIVTPSNNQTLTLATATTPKSTSTTTTTTTTTTTSDVPTNLTTPSSNSTTRPTSLSSIGGHTAMNQDTYNENSINAFRRFKSSIIYNETNDNDNDDAHEDERSIHNQNKIVRQLQQIKNCLTTAASLSTSNNLTIAHYSNATLGTSNQHHHCNHPTDLIASRSVGSNLNNQVTSQQSSDDEASCDRISSISLPEDSTRHSSSPSSISEDEEEEEDVRSATPSSSISNQSQTSSHRTQSPSDMSMHGASDNNNPSHQSGAGSCNNNHHNNTNNLADKQVSNKYSNYNNNNNNNIDHSHHNDKNNASSNLNSKSNPNQDQTNIDINSINVNDHQQISLYSVKEGLLSAGGTLKESSYTTSVITTTAPMHFKTLHHHPFSLKQFPPSPYHQFSNSSFNHDFYDRYLSHDSHQPLQTPLIGIERTQDLLSLKLPPHGPDENDSQRFPKDWLFEDHNHRTTTASAGAPAATSSSTTSAPVPSTNDNHQNKTSNNNSLSSKIGRASDSQANDLSSHQRVGSGSKRKDYDRDHNDEDVAGGETSRHKSFKFSYKSNSNADVTNDDETNKSTNNSHNNNNNNNGQTEPIDLNVSYGQDGSCNSNDEDNMFNQSMKHFNPERIQHEASCCKQEIQSSPHGSNNEGNASDGSHRVDGTGNGQMDGHHVDNVGHQYHHQESMFGIEQAGKQKFKYVLAAPISVATKLNEDTMTYLNQGQAYEIKLENITDVSEAKKGFMCSIINIGFHERHMQQVENELWQQWSQQHPNEKIFSVDMKLSYNVFGVESDGLNKYEFLWDSSKAAGVFIRINSISTEFTPKKHGGEKGVPFKLSIETFSYNSKTHDSYFISAACCQIKVFKPKGAERKIRSDRDKLLKRPPNERDKYHHSCDYTLFCDCSLNSLHPMADDSLCYYRHSHGHFASNKIGINSVSGTPVVQVQSGPSNNHHNSTSDGGGGGGGGGGVDPASNASQNNLQSPEGNSNNNNNSNSNSNNNNNHETTMSQSRITNNSDNETSNNAGGSGQLSGSGGSNEGREFRSHSSRNSNNLSSNLTPNARSHTDYSTSRLMPGVSFNSPDHQQHTDIHQHNYSGSLSSSSLASYPTNSYHHQHTGPEHLNINHSPEILHHTSQGRVGALNSLNGSQHFNMSSYYNHPTVPQQQAAPPAPPPPPPPPPPQSHMMPHANTYALPTSASLISSYSIHQQQHIASVTGGAQSIYRQFNNQGRSVNASGVPTSTQNTSFRASNLAISSQSTFPPSLYLHQDHCQANDSSQHDVKDHMSAFLNQNQSHNHQHHQRYGPHHLDANLDSHHSMNSNNPVHMQQQSQQQQHQQHQQQQQQQQSFRQRSASTSSANPTSAHYANHGIQMNTHHHHHHPNFQPSRQLSNDDYNPSIENNNQSHMQWSSSGNHSASNSSCTSTGCTNNVPMVHGQETSYDDGNNTSNNRLNNLHHSYESPSSDHNSPHKGQTNANIQSPMRNTSGGGGYLRYRVSSGVSNSSNNLDQQAINGSRFYPSLVGHSQAITVNSGCSEVAMWLIANRFGLFSKTFNNFSGSDLLRLSKTDLTEICGLLDGIRLYNCLHNKPIKPKRVLYICHSDSSDVFHPIYLYHVSLKELLSEITLISRAHLDGPDCNQSATINDEHDKNHQSHSRSNILINSASSTDSRSSMGANSAETLGAPDDLVYVAGNSQTGSGSGESHHGHSHHHFFNDIDLAHRNNQTNTSNNNNTHRHAIAHKAAGEGSLSNEARQQVDGHNIGRLLIDGLTSVRIVATEQVVQMLDDESVWTLNISCDESGFFEACLVSMRNKQSSINSK